MLVTRRLLLGSTFATLIALPGRAATRVEPRVITAQKGNCRILPKPAAETVIFGYAGQVPGPLLRCKRGEDVNLKLVNQLDEPVTFSCWGIRLDNAMDGIAGLTQKPILPGQTFNYTITPPDSGFYWYRSQVVPLLGEQLRRGLYGPFIVDESDPPVVDRDVVVVLSKWLLDDGEQIIAGHVGVPIKTGADATADASHAVTTANSEPIPLAEELSPGARLRLRLLNATVTEMMFVTFDGVRPMVLAIDGQPCEAFEPLQQLLPIGPGGRFDVMFDLPDEADTQSRLVLRSNEGPDQTILTLRTKGEKRARLPTIVSLPQNPLLPSMIKLQASRKVNLLIAGGPAPTPASSASSPSVPFTLGGVAATDFGPMPLFCVPRGTPVTLGLVNKTAFTQEVHVRGHVMRLLHNLDDGWDPYWRDSAIVPEMRSKHVAFVADNPGKWAIECLPINISSTEMMTWFEVL